jgi:hydantoinase/carbamoylase family amidase
VGVVEDLAVAARYGTDERGGITRAAWTPELEDALAWFRGRLTDAGLEVEVDPAGNVFGRWGSSADGGVLVASHLDTVPCGGAFDGALGVIGGLAAIELLRGRGYEPRRPLLVGAFMDEEGSRFGVSMFGSRAFVGDDLSEAASLRDETGTTLAEAMAAAGFDVKRVPAARAVDRLSAYLELHVEQGPVLEREGIEIGVVSGVVGLLQMRVRLRGQATHAGTTPLALRRDALAGAARIVLALRDEAGARGAVATVGMIGVEPGAFNVVPGRCTFTVDYRVLDANEFAQAETVVRDIVERLAAEEGLDAELTILDRDAPVQFHAGLVDVVEEAAALEGASSMRMPSGAGHDAMLVARHVPAAMLFVPSRGGISHNAQELTEPEHCELGVRVLARAIELLDRDDGSRARR